MNVRLINKSKLLVATILLLSAWACNPLVTTPTATLIPASPTFTRAAIISSSTASATITPSPLPLQPILPIFTPDPVQMEQWKEYQTALAKTILSFVYPEHVLCEWDILGRSESGREIY